MSNQDVSKVRDFWNERAGLGEWAGSRDVTAKELEMQTIAKYVRDGMRILEVGCGNGITAIELARQFDVKITGVDYAEEMISAAKNLAANQDLKGTLEFRVGDVRKLEDFPEKFDLIYTERVLINLPDWDSQRQAIADITALLAIGAAFVMCENSQDGLEKINEMRRQLGLEAVVPPWHNRYLRDAELETVEIPGVRLEAMDYYSSTYYFLSRVINAALAAQEGAEPSYEAPINQLALKLPAIGEFGQGRIWVWRKTA